MLKVFRLNNEIKKVTENAKDLSELSNSNSKITEQQNINEQFMDLKIWKDRGENKTQCSTDQYLSQYESLKNKNDSMFNHTSDIDEFAEFDEVNENDHGVINKISSIDIKHPNFNSTKPTSNENINTYKCITEPDEYFFRPSFPINTPQKNSINVNYSNPYCHFSLMNSFNSQMNNIYKGSFVSTQYSSNKIYHKAYGSNEDIFLENEDTDGNSNSTNNNNNYKGLRIPTSESNESNQSSRYQNGLMIEDNSAILNKVFKPNTAYYTRVSKGKKNEIGQRGERQLINLDDIASGKDTRTTVMIRNIPIKYTDKMLQKEIEEFNEKYDCLYMPYDYEKGGNKGYAFINFIHPLHILMFFEKFQNKTWTHFESKKICELNFANFQGIAEIQKHAKNYKGLKKPIFVTGLDSMKKLEIPKKYINKVKNANPKMKYKENKDIILIKSLE